MNAYVEWLMANGIATFGWLGASIWFCVMLTQKRFSARWLVASCLLFAASLVTMVGISLTAPKSVSNAAVPPNGAAARPAR